MEYVNIETSRDSYSPKGRTITVGELIDILNGYDDDTPVYLSFDNGYTYGCIDKYDINLETFGDYWSE